LSTPEKFDCVKTTTVKVGGRDVRSTMMNLMRLLMEAAKLSGPDGVTTVTVSAHVPTRRLTSAIPDPTD
jgi:hypothetical protein